MSNVQVREAAVNNKDLLGLIAKLDRYLYELYPADEVFVVDLEAASQDDNIVFVLAYEGENAVGCGAYLPLDESSVELKRFYVEPDKRGTGVAAAIFRYLSDKARALGYTSLKLETGDEQPEAIRFYTKNGFRRIDRFGEYVNSDSSVCMEKVL
ncbi:GNAT family N-acetyltransferase [Paenibacillus kobensis]|uniref:GNAT family N-acetyltransferase n=1 Tax=Paenibacillus kobensis TaxID=59841 RepID=UPI000FD7F5CE|nr:GNAT family N-acetyltransferase [Paenibacillus kobensis]